MKIRIKFGKHGYMKFVGHLDIMRFFQKVNRMAGIDICYSEGFSPHQKMSFASPLGVGLQSTGEYVDMEVHSVMNSAEAVERLNKVMVEGVNVYSYRLLPDDAENAMSLVAAADYLVTFKNNKPWQDKDKLKELLEDFMSKENIEILKKSKKSEKITDIRPLIYESKVTEDIANIISDDDISLYGLQFKLAAGSVNNLKPELVIEAFLKDLGLEFQDYPINIYRLEMYAEAEAGSFIALQDLGTEIKD